MRPSVLVLLLAGCTPDGGLKVYNTPPDVSLTSPADGSSFAEGVEVLFAASVHDNQQGISDLELVWNLDDGSELVGEQTFTDAGVLFVARDLPAGDRIVTLLALDDKSESGEDSVDIHIVPDLAPTVSFLAPLEGEVVAAEDRLRVEVRAADADEGDLSALSLVWSGAAVSDAPASADSSGSAAFYIESLTPGDQEIGVTVTDSLGATGSALVAFEAVLADADLDGHRDTAWGGDDCDDGDAAVHPDAAEVCNGLDDDCDGAIDEEGAVDAPTWYADLDVDGFGDPAGTWDACEAPEGYVADDTDCDDTDGAVFPDAEETCDGVDQDCDGGVDEEDATGEPTWYSDVDGDGFGDPGAPVQACDLPAGSVADATDCDDTDSRTFPGATEVCDGEDDDCDGTVDEDDAADAPTWYVDADGDGFGGPTTTRACVQPTGTYSTSDDCDDGDSGVSPGSTERCDGEDDDCDGTVDDDDAADAPTWYVDADGDNWGEPSLTAVACAAPSGFVAYDTDCDDGDAAFHPGAAETGCADPNDYNCDGAVGYTDGDGDGWAACEECDDLLVDVNPGATEVCNEGDDDCDGAIDEPDAADALIWYADTDGDEFGDRGSTTPACEEPAGYVADDSDCDDGDTTENPAASERCDGDDDDCDGAVDEDDAVDAPTWYADTDGDTYGNATVTDVECSAPSGYVASFDDCDDTRAATYPGAPEYCNTRDDDCDGAIDEDSAVDATTWYSDADGDTYGSAAVTDIECTVPAGYVSDSTDCDDARSTSHPTATEYCNTRDDDCDGVVDEDGADGATWYADADADGHGDAYVTTAACSAPSGYVALFDDCDDTDRDTNPAAAEYCDGEDDDCDGTVDEDDAADASNWYLDNDDDAFGQTGVYIVACDEPEGYTAESGDCDDTDAYASPFADEYCDGDDDNCDGTVDEDAAVDATTWYADSDADTYGDPGLSDVACYLPSGYVADATDCDDTSAAISPADPEVCDPSDTDEDCDGVADDEDASASAATKSTFYADSDGDGYAGVTTSLRCDASSTHLATSTDCNDSSAAISPAAAEVCDALDVDEDCDGAADGEGSGGCTTFYEDADGDGYGDPAFACLCSSAGTFTATNDDDCDDTDADVNPGEEESVNGLDDDCDGVTDEPGLEWPMDDVYEVTALPLYHATNTTYAHRYLSGGSDVDGDGFEEIVHVYGTTSGLVIREQRSVAVSSSTLYSITSTTYGLNAVAVVGDQDGDGKRDILTAATSMSTYGRAYLLQADSLSSANVTTVASTTFTATSSSPLFGLELADAGDVYADGTGDLLISALGSTTVTPKVFLYDGPTASGSVATSSAAATFVGSIGEGLGYAVDGGGDLDGDGTPDIVIGAYAAASSAGKVYVQDGASAVGTITAGTGSEAVLTGQAGGDYAGFSLDLAPDLNGDGYDDLLVGAYGYSTAGRAYIVLGPVTSGSLASADVIIDDGGTSVSSFGVAVDALGDIDDDGREDVGVLGTGGYGALYLYGWDGSGTWYPEDAFAGFEGRWDWDVTEFAPAGDLDADGIDDMLVLSSYAFAATNPYRLHTVHANLRRLNTNGGDTAVTVTSEAGNPGLGVDVSTAGDFNADGYADMIVGAESAGGDEGGDGGAYLYLGPFDESETTRSADGLFVGESYRDYIGSAVAGGADFDGDIYDDLLLGGPQQDTTAGTNAGAVYLFAGAAVGYSAATPAADATFYGAARAGDQFGYRIEVLGDMDGDTYDEFVAGAPYNDQDGTDGGRAYLYAAPFSASGEVAVATFTAEAAGDNLGMAVGGGGDVNGDDFPDVMLGAPNNDDAALSAGAAYLFTSMPSGSTPASTADAILRGADRQDYAGTSVAIVGDVNGDGYDDYAVGAPSGAGYVYVFHGAAVDRGEVSVATADWQLDEVLFDGSGTEVTAAGDINNDGLADLLFSGSLASAGMAAIHGPLENRTPFYFNAGGVPPTRFGVGGIGDQDGDGYDDFAVGSSTDNSSGTVWVENGR
ncbi:MAG: MopE-related protein [Pseudomonadota bacterium]|nr:MopE-related protein [Pseudomonadota bacterium]